MDLFKCDNNFCFVYELEEGCTKDNCIKRLISKNYLNPYIIYKEEDIISNESISNKFNSLLTNELTTCKKCGYNDKGIILDESKPTFYRLIIKKLFPKIIFVIFDLSDINDKGTRSELEIIEYSRRKNYNDKLFKVLVNNFSYENHNYELKALILTPQSDHFTSVLLNYDKGVLGLKKGVNYFYDGIKANHYIEEINNLHDLIKDNIIYLGLYIEKI